MEEAELKIPQTPYYKDLDKLEVLAKNEIGFTKVIVLSLWTQVNALLEGEADVCVKNLNQNIIEWQKIHDEIVPPQPVVSHTEEKKEDKPSALKLIAEKARVSFAAPSSRENSARDMTASDGMDESLKKLSNNDDSTPVNDDDDYEEEDEGDDDNENMEEIEEENV